MLFCTNLWALCRAHVKESYSNTANSQEVVALLNPADLHKKHFLRFCTVGVRLNTSGIYLEQVCFQQSCPTVQHLLKIILILEITVIYLSFSNIWRSMKGITILWQLGEKKKKIKSSKWMLNWECKLKCCLWVSSKDCSLFSLCV